MHEETLGFLYKQLGKGRERLHVTRIQRLQRKGFLPPCEVGREVEPVSGNKGWGKLLGSSGKGPAPACGKALMEAGRVTADGMLLSGRGSEALYVMEFMVIPMATPGTGELVRI